MEMRAFVAESIVEGIHGDKKAWVVDRRPCCPEDADFVGGHGRPQKNRYHSDRSEDRKAQPPAGTPVVH